MRSSNVLRILLSFHRNKLKFNHSTKNIPLNQKQQSSVVGVLLYLHLFLNIQVIHFIVKTNKKKCFCIHMQRQFLLNVAFYLIRLLAPFLRISMLISFALKRYGAHKNDRIQTHKYTWRDTHPTQTYTALELKECKH